MPIYWRRNLACRWCRRSRCASAGSMRCRQQLDGALAAGCATPARNLRHASSRPQHGHAARACHRAQGDGRRNAHPAMDSNARCGAAASGRWACHPAVGLLFVMFQGVSAGRKHLSAGSRAVSPPVRGNCRQRSSPIGFVRSFLIDGVIAGVGAVVVFLPQILILFLFILLLEAVGLHDARGVPDGPDDGGVGLNGARFIPLLSRFACAIPGIMATRTIEDPKDRLTTILIAPLMTCSARLPVYARHHRAFIPDRSRRASASRDWCCSRSMSPASSARWSSRSCCAGR